MRNFRNNGKRPFRRLIFYKAYDFKSYEKGANMKEKINEFLKFRSQFTKREWFEINQVIDERLNQKADQLKLDDLDVEIISKRLERKK